MSAWPARDVLAWSIYPPKLISRMSYLTEFGDKLLSLLGDVPEDKRAEIITFAQNEVYKSAKNGVAKGKETPAKPKGETPKRPSLSRT